MKQIPLTRGKYTIVDNADYDWLSQWKWFALETRGGNFYAARQSPGKNGKQNMIRMHRQILGLEKGDKQESDHKDRNTLNNSRDNLRICTHRQNMRNRKSDSNTTSRFKGVSWNRLEQKWIARLVINGEVKHLGYWAIEEVAALAYDMVAIREHGEFAYLNFN